MTPATLAARGGLAPAPPPPPAPGSPRNGNPYAPARPGRPCGICGAPEDGHGVRYATLAGHHTWSHALRLANDYLGVGR